MQIDQTSITFVLSLIAVGSVLFQVYNSYRNPQIKTDQETVTLKGQIDNLKAEIKDIKETHLRSLENQIKDLTSNISTLSGTVIKLATIIDERIPRGQSNLTPPGQ